MALHAVAECQKAGEPGQVFHIYFFYMSVCHLLLRLPCLAGTFPFPRIVFPVSIRCYVLHELRGQIGEGGRARGHLFLPLFLTRVMSAVAGRWIFFCLDSPSWQPTRHCYEAIGLKERNSLHTTSGRRPKPGVDKTSVRPSWRSSLVGGTAVFIDAEHALDSAYAKAIGVDMTDLYLAQPDNGEQGKGTCFYVSPALARPYR